MVTISGTTVVQDTTSTTPEAGVAVAAYAVGSTTPLGMTTSDAQGMYSLTVPTSGQPIDGYLKATKSGMVDSYVYPPAPIAADTTGATATLVSSSNFSELLSLEGASSNAGTIILIVLDATSNPVQGATVKSSPAASKTTYMGSNGEPFSTSSTYSDGLAFLFGVPTGTDVTVSATKSGSTFASHAVQTYAGALTTTLVLAQ